MSMDNNQLKAALDQAMAYISQLEEAHEKRLVEIDAAMEQGEEYKRGFEAAFRVCREAMADVHQELRERPARGYVRIEVAGRLLYDERDHWT